MNEDSIWADRYERGRIAQGLDWDELDEANYEEMVREECIANGEDVSNWRGEDD